LARAYLQHAQEGAKIAGRQGPLRFHREANASREVAQFHLFRLSVALAAADLLASLIYRPERSREATTTSDSGPSVSPSTPLDAQRSARFSAFDIAANATPQVRLGGSKLRR
jgi:hypothetical protein